MTKREPLPWTLSLSDAELDTLVDLVDGALDDARELSPELEADGPDGVAASAAYVAELEALLSRLMALRGE